MNEEGKGQEEDGDTNFYISEEEFNDQRLLNRLSQANVQIEKIAAEEATEENEDIRTQIQAILLRLEEEVEKNKFGDLDKAQRQERDNYLAERMTEGDREFVETIDQV